MLEFNGQKQTLKYLFFVEFADGKIYEQNEQDTSVLNAEKSCFFDVLQEQETNPVVSFSLTDGVKVSSVNLLTGEFNIDGTTFKLHDEGVNYFNRRLIFFRRRSVNMINGEELGCKYAIGWQGNIAPETDSKCEQFKLFLD